MNFENKEEVSVTVIEGKAADWKKFKDIRLEALQQEPQAFGASYEGDVQKTDESWQEGLENPKRAYSFLEIGDEYVGMSGAKDVETGEWMIIAVYLRSAFRGQGYAEKLLTSVEKSLQDKGVNTAILMVNKKQEQAVFFYKKIGYEITGEENDLLMGDGNNHDEYIMKKNLSSR